MQKDNIEVMILSKYGGGVKAVVRVGESVPGKEIITTAHPDYKYQEYVLEIEYLEEYLAKILREKGYTTSISKRQKYPRISFNP